MRAPIGAVPALALAFIVAAASAAPAPSAAIRGGSSRPPRPGVVLALLHPEAATVDPTGGTMRGRDAALQAAFSQLGLARATRIGRGPVRTDRPLAVALHSDEPGFDPYAAAAALRALPGVVAAAPDLRLSLHLVPNDPYLSTQWHLGTSTAAVRARPAWDLETGSGSVTIGVLDTGVDTGHEDFSGKIWQNPGEIPGNGLDDDANGYVDDVQGWDFGDDDGDPSPEPFFDAATGIDVGWHGTFVAGLAAAATNNGVGIAGVAWGCRVMPLKVADATGDMPLSAVTEAIAYAIDNGAAVLNMSLGSPDTTAASFFQPLMTAAFDGGVVTVASAGNDGTDERNFPAACDSVLAVAATDASNNRASFSNWGPWVDLAAPGAEVWSSIADNYVYDDVSQIIFEVLWWWDTVNPYMYGDGTSFSAPVVAGAAALVRSRFPALTAGQVAQQLVTTGDARAYDNPIGPRLNVEQALLSSPLDVSPSSSPGALAFAAPAPNPAAGAVRFAFTLPRGGRVTLAIVDAQGRLVCEAFAGDLGAGARSVAWDGRDLEGRPVPAGLYFAVLGAAGERAMRRVAILR